jgi:hypothetical protein
LAAKEEEEREKKLRNQPKMTNYCYDSSGNKINKVEVFKNH